MSYIGNTPSETFHTATSQVFNGDGSTTAFTLEKRVNRAEDLEVFVNNIQQQPTVAYSANNTTLTFTEAPDSATGNIYVVYRMFAQENTFNAIHDFTDAVTFNGDVTFTGANGNVLFDKSEDTLSFADNIFAKFGTGNDLRIFHSGSNSFIQEGGTGDLYIQSATVNITDTSSTPSGKFIDGGAVELYHNGTKKFETETNGVIVTGRITTSSHIDVNNSSGYGRLEIGGSSGGLIDLKSPFSDDFDHRIVTTGSGASTLQVQSDDFHLMNRLGTENYLDATVNGAVNLYYDNVKKFETTSAGVTITGSILPSADDTHDLGSSSAQWRDIYTGDINLNNTKTRDNEVDGTRGSWTIQEGADDLFLINRLNGKKYKFKLEEM